MMRISGLWSPREGVWEQVLIGQDPWRLLAVEADAYADPLSTPVSGDLAGHWPRATKRFDDRLVNARDVALEIEQLFSEALPTADAPHISQSAIGAISAAPARLELEQWGRLAHLLMNVHGVPNFSRAFMWWAWIKALAALYYGDCSKHAMELAAGNAIESLYPNLKEDTKQARQAEMQNRFVLFDALMAERGALQHLISRAYGTKFFGPFGWLGTPYAVLDSFWFSGAICAHTYRTLTETSPGIDTASIYAAVGESPLLYAAAKTLLSLSEIDQGVDWAAMLETHGQESSTLAQTMEPLPTARQAAQTLYFDHILATCQDERTRQTLLPVIDEPQLLSVVSSVMRVRWTTTARSIDSSLLERCVWHFLLLLGDPAAAGTPSVANTFDLGTNAPSPYEFDWLSPPPEFELSDALVDWRVVEILLPLVGATIHAMLRGRASIDESESLWESPAFADFSVKPLLTIRAFLDACLAVWRDRSQGLTTKTAAKAAGITESALKEWLGQQPFYLSDIERLLINLHAADDEVTLGMAGGLLESRASRGHCIPDWLSTELDLLEGTLHDKKYSKTPTTMPVIVTGETEKPKRQRRTQKPRQTRKKSP